jgi:putative methyltransferase (TIGR04325 family)
MKRFIKSLIPPILLDILKKIKPNKYGWHGDYASWAEARANAIGYDSNEILQKVRASLLKVKNGEAVYERDSVIFDEVQYSWPLLAGLMYAAAKSGGVLKVLDFGGSLGSTYFQNKKFLDGLNEVSWSVVEQKHFVDVGRVDFQDERLKFFYDVKSCIESEKPNILVLLSALQYIEKPYELLDEILQYGFEYVIFDRTPFSLGNEEKIKLQRVSPKIYNASYPCWFFSKRKFFNYFLTQNYNVVESFNTFNELSKDYSLDGIIFRKKQ